MRDLSHARDPAFWSDIWDTHLERYLGAPPRTGYWLAGHYPLKGRAVLEVGAGSARDSLALAKHRAIATASDFDATTIARLRELLAERGVMFKVEDALSLSFESASFFLSFSNGLWILFEDDDIIRALALEQARVTSSLVVSLVHNGENQRLVSELERKAQTDPLYRIRVFKLAELEAILAPVASRLGATIRLRKFGGPVDRLYRLNARGFSPMTQLFVPRLYRLQPWSRVERIAIELRLPADSVA